MTGLGTIVNIVAISIGSLIGITIGYKLPTRIHSLLTKAMGLAVIGIGIKMFLVTEHIIIVILSLVIGGVAGELIGVEKFIEWLGKKIKTLIKTDDNLFLDGFVTSSIMFCIGPMAILGSIADGMNGQHDVLFSKALLDGTMSIALAASLGIGVLFSTIPLFIYQGAITILAVTLGNIFSEVMIAELTSTGGLLIAAIGINVLGSLKDDKRIAVGNLLPALVLVVLFVWLSQTVGVL